MSITIPKSLQKQISRRAQKRGVTQLEYVRIALKQAIAAEDDMAEEMRPWEEASLQDFAKFAKKYKL